MDHGNWHDVTVDISLGPANPSVAVYGDLSNGEDYFTLDWSRVTNETFKNLTGGAADTFFTQLLPIAKDDQYALGFNSINGYPEDYRYYPAYEIEETYQLNIDYDTQEPFTLYVLRSCTAIGEEKDFVPDTTKPRSGSYWRCCLVKGIINKKNIS